MISPLRALANIWSRITLYYARLIVKGVTGIEWYSYRDSNPVRLAENQEVYPITYRSVELVEAVEVESI
jgi:hypothetical protein